MNDTCTIATLTFSEYIKGESKWKLRQNEKNVQQL